MSDRVDRIVFTKKKNESIDVLFSKVNTQVRLLLDMGYNCFISRSSADGDDIVIEFCKSDPELKDETIPQPCWLYQGELESLSYFQLQNAYEEARQAVNAIEEELYPPEEIDNKKASAKQKDIKA